MATTIFLESGSDATQDLTFYSSTTGTVASATDQAFTGPRSVKLSTGAGPADAFLFRSGVLADTGRRVSFRLRTSAIPATGAGVVIFYKADGTTAVFTLNIVATTFFLSGSPAGVGQVSGATSVGVADRWDRICISYFITNTTTFGWKVYLNDVLQLTINSGTMTQTGTDTVAFRLRSTVGTNVDRWFDDVVIDDGASSSDQPDTGDVRVTAKRPFANGTTNGFTTQIGVGGSGYGSGHAPQVNEQPLSVTNGWSMVGAGSAITEEYNVEGLTVGDVNVSGKQIVDLCGWVYAKALTNETASLVLNGATSDIALTGTNTLFRAYAGSGVAPAGSGADIGIVTSTDLTTVSLYEAGILIVYKVPPPSSTLSMMGV